MMKTMHRRIAKNIQRLGFTVADAFERKSVCVGPVKFEVKKWLGSGGQAHVFLGSEPRTGDEVAIKFSSTYSLAFRTERDFYKRLEGCEGFPKVYGLYTSPEASAFTMEYLGPDIGKLSRQRRFSLKTVLKIGMQLVDRVEAMHERGIIHRDIKPFNIAIGRHNHKVIHVFDLGLAKQFVDHKGEHLPDSKSVGNPCGTPEFMSLNVHNREEASRRDDMESLLYTLMYMLYGGLPWEFLRQGKR